jgi:hypothetical protein
VLLIETVLNQVLQRLKPGLDELRQQCPQLFFQLVIQLQLEELLELLKSKLLRLLYLMQVLNDSHLKVGQAVLIQPACLVLFGTPNSSRRRTVGKLGWKGVEQKLCDMVMGVIDNPEAGILDNHLRKERNNFVEEVLGTRRVVAGDVVVTLFNPRVVVGEQDAGEPFFSH